MRHQVVVFHPKLLVCVGPASEKIAKTRKKKRVLGPSAYRDDFLAWLESPGFLEPAEQNGLCCLRDHLDAKLTEAVISRAQNVIVARQKESVVFTRVDGLD